MFGKLGHKPVKALKLFRRLLNLPSHQGFENSKSLVYNGPATSFLKTTKIFLYTLSGLSLPAIGLIALTGKEQIVGSVLAAVASILPITAAHQFSKNYVTELYIHNVNPSKESKKLSKIKDCLQLTMVTTSLFSKPIHTTIWLRDLERVRPTFFKYVTWRVKNRHLYPGLVQQDFFVEEKLLLKSERLKVLVENIR